MGLDVKNIDENIRALMRVAGIFDKILKALNWLAGAMIIFLTLAVSYSVIMRYLFKRPPMWVVQVSEYMLLWITFLGAAWILRKEAHITVDILTSRLSEKIRETLGLITSAIGAVACLIIAWFGTETTWTYFQTNVVEAKAMYISKAPIISIIALGAFLLFIQFARNTWDHLRRMLIERER